MSLLWIMLSLDSPVSLSCSLFLENFSRLHHLKPLSSVGSPYVSRRTRHALHLCFPSTRSTPPHSHSCPPSITIFIISRSSVTLSSPSLSFRRISYFLILSHLGRTSCILLLPLQFPHSPPSPPPSSPSSSALSISVIPRTTDILHDHRCNQPISSSSSNTHLIPLHPIQSIQSNPIHL